MLRFELTQLSKNRFDTLCYDIYEYIFLNLDAISASNFASTNRRHYNVVKTYIGEDGFDLMMSAVLLDEKKKIVKTLWPRVFSMVDRKVKSIAFQQEKRVIRKSTQVGMVTGGFTLLIACTVMSILFPDYIRVLHEADVFLSEVKVNQKKFKDECRHDPPNPCDYTTNCYSYSSMTRACIQLCEEILGYSHCDALREAPISGFKLGTVILLMLLALALSGIAYARLKSIEDDLYEFVYESNFNSLDFSSIDDDFKFILRKLLIPGNLSIKEVKGLLQDVNNCLDLKFKDLDLPENVLSSCRFFKNYRLPIVKIPMREEVKQLTSA